MIAEVLIRAHQRSQPGVSSFFRRRSGCCSRHIGGRFSVIPTAAVPIGPHRGCHRHRKQRLDRHRRHSYLTVEGGETAQPRFHRSCCIRSASAAARFYPGAAPSGTAAGMRRSVFSSLGPRPEITPGPQRAEKPQRRQRGRLFGLTREPERSAPAHRRSVMPRTTRRMRRPSCHRLRTGLNSARNSERINTGKLALAATQIARINSTLST